jgi:hypothetical protein
MFGQGIEGALCLGGPSFIPPKDTAHQDKTIFLKVFTSQLKQSSPHLNSLKKYG